MVLMITQLVCEDSMYSSVHPKQQILINYRSVRSLMARHQPHESVPLTEFSIVALINLHCLQFT